MRSLGEDLHGILAGVDAQQEFTQIDQHLATNIHRQRWLQKVRRQESLAQTVQRGWHIAALLAKLGHALVHEMALVSRHQGAGSVVKGRALFATTQLLQQTGSTQGGFVARGRDHQGTLVAGQRLLERALLAAHVTRFQPTAEVVGMGIKQRCKPVTRCATQALVDRATCPLKCRPFVLRFGLQQGCVGLVGLGELVLLEQLVSCSAGGCGAGEQGLVPESFGNYVVGGFSLLGGA